MSGDAVDLDIGLPRPSSGILFLTNQNQGNCDDHYIGLDAEGIHTTDHLSLDGGGHKASEFDRGHYHILIEGDGKVRGTGSPDLSLRNTNLLRRRHRLHPLAWPR